MTDPQTTRTPDEDATRTHRAVPAAPGGGARPSAEGTAETAGRERLSLDTSAHSEIGLVRKNNQDSAYTSPTMIVVADGMGGAAAGDLASAATIQELARGDTRHEGEQMLEGMAGILTRANDRLADLINADPELEGMGTTVCGAMFSGTQLGLAHIGDSPAILLKQHGVFTIGPTIEKAVQAAVMVEDVARTVHLARQLGEPKPIAQSDIDKLFERYQNVYGQH